MSLPPLADVGPNLPKVLDTLFEPSPTLHNLLVPAVAAKLAASPSSVNSYSDLVDLCAETANGWNYDQKADFVSGHPMIGEVGNLSALSAKEQTSMATRPIVLERLAHLNNVYCAVFPGLRFITFVNGRPRSAIVNAMEEWIGLETSPDPLPDSYPVTEPKIDSETVQLLVRPRDGGAWRAECDRAVSDVWRIAKARIKGMGLE